MNIEEIRNYCLTKPGTTESFPFDDVTLVFKVMDKMYALVSLDGDLQINLKCDPDEAIKLREHYNAVIPGYHMNKKHWNSILLDETINETLIKEWIDNSYELIVNSLPKKKKEELENLKIK